MAYRNKPKVLLCIPPDYSCDFPPLATPVLTAFLKTKRIDAYQIDLNILYRDFLTDRIKTAKPLGIKTKRTILEKVLLTHFDDANFKDGYYFDLLSVTKNNCLSHLPYGNNRNSSFFFTERLLSSPLLWRYLDDPVENSFYEFYMINKFISSIVDEKFNMLGISITSPSQAIPALTLGFLLKRAAPQIHIVIGGQWPSLYREELATIPDLSRCFDSIVHSDGETPLLQLADALSAKRDFSGIPNLIYWDGKRFLINKELHEEDLRALPPPDFDDLPLTSYEGYKPSGTKLTYETSRGCYWNKCIYCVDLPIPKASYRTKDTTQVIREIKILRNKYKARHLMFSDPALSPRLMTSISCGIIENGVDIRWWAMARLDRKFDDETFNMAKRSGCHGLSFGFESANDRVCDFAHKGNSLATSLEVIKKAHKAGIWISLQIMMGMPTETEKEVWDTIEFLIRNRRHINNTVINTYYLTPKNYVYESPEKFGIKMMKDPSLPFQFFIPFRQDSISMATAERMNQAYYTLLARYSAAQGKKSSRVIHCEGEFKLCGRTSHFRI